MKSIKNSIRAIEQQQPPAQKQQQQPIIVTKTKIAQNNSSSNKREEPAMIIERPRKFRGSDILSGLAKLEKNQRVRVTSNEGTYEGRVYEIDSIGFSINKVKCLKNTREFSLNTLLSFEFRESPLDGIKKHQQQIEIKSNSTQSNK